MFGSGSFLSNTFSRVFWSTVGDWTNLYNGSELDEYRDYTAAHLKQSRAMVEEEEMKAMLDRSASRSTSNPSKTFPARSSNGIDVPCQFKTAAG